jgi:hypothetical protein
MAATEEESASRKEEEEEEDVATVQELNAIVFASEDEKKAAVGNLVADDEWGGLTMELADLVRVSGRSLSGELGGSCGRRIPFLPRGGLSLSPGLVWSSLAYEMLRLTHKLLLLLGAQSWKM